MPSSRDHCPAGVDITSTSTSLSAMRKVLPLIPYIRKWPRNPATYFITSWFESLVLICAYHPHHCLLLFNNCIVTGFIRIVMFRKLLSMHITFSSLSICCTSNIAFIFIEYFHFRCNLQIRMRKTVWDCLEFFFNYFHRK